MDFRFTEEQEMTAGVVRALLADLCQPADLRRLMAEGAARDEARWSRIVDIGLAGALVPEDGGGLGLAPVDFVLVAQAAGYASSLAARPARPVHVESSRGDPFLGASRRLADELSKRGVPCDLSVSPGPHDQPFLRDVGSLEMLLWHDRRLNPR